MPNSYIFGTRVFVKIEEIVENKARFLENSTNNKVCVSLDDAPFYCTSTLNITFAGVLEGQHTLSTRIWIKGNLIEDSQTEVVVFTIINDLSLIGRLDYDDDDDEVLTQAEQNRSNEKVMVEYPNVKIASPLLLGTYRPNLPLLIDIEPSNKKQFERYFRNGYKCFCIDGGSGFGCFPLFSNEDMHPLVVGLTPGLHTVEAILLDPRSGELLPLSSSGTTTFFTVGQNNEGSIMVGKLEFEGMTYSVPIENGGDISTQATIFCSDIKHLAADCVLSASNHLKNIAIQLKLLEDEVFV